MTVGRKRSGRFGDRPKNVLLDTQGSVTYFRYVMPDGTRKVIGDSRDRAKAYDLADALNGYWAQQRQQLELGKFLSPKVEPEAEPPATCKASATNPTIPKLIEEFKKHDPKRKRYSERSLEELDYKLAQYARLWPEKTVQEMHTTDFAQFLNTLTDNAYVKHRPALMRLMQFAGHQGYRGDNPVAVTLEKEEADKVRQHHTWDGLQKILNHPTLPAHMHRAIRLATFSLQRREDLVLLNKHLNKVDVTARTMTILQRKSRNYTNPVWLEIEMSGELLTVIDECLRSPVLCPYLLHYKPEKLSEKTREAKPHAFAMTPGWLSKEFSYWRDEAHAYDHLKPEQRPTLHELRGFGMHLYQQAGYEQEYIMALSGHATDAMFRRYTEDHEQKKPKKVQAGLARLQLPSS